MYLKLLFDFIIIMFCEIKNGFMKKELCDDIIVLYVLDLYISSCVFSQDFFIFCLIMYYQVIVYIKELFMSIKYYCVCLLYVK